MELQVRAEVSRRVVRLARGASWSLLLLVACGTGPLDAPRNGDDDGPPTGPGTPSTEGRVVFF